MTVPSTEATCQVSVIIPAYNAAAFIDEALQSVLEQDVSGCEILVIDDGSTDQTPAVLARYGNQSAVRVLRHPGGANRGVCASRRLALTEARGEFVAFLDADDCYLPGKLHRHIELLRADPDVVLVHGAVKSMGQISNHENGPEKWFSMGASPHTYDLTTAEHFLRSNNICNSTVVCRMTAIDRDVLPESMVFQFEDWLLWSETAQRGLFHYDPVPLSSYRFHAASFSSRQIERPGTWELAHIELLLTLFTRFRDARLRQCAVDALTTSITVLAKKRDRSMPGIARKETELEVLSALNRSIRPRLFSVRHRATRWWRLMSALKRSGHIAVNYGRQKMTRK